MAYPIQVTLTTGNKVSLNYQSQEVSVTLTYQLERHDTDVPALVQEKTKELAQAHQLAWQGLHEAKVATVQPHPTPNPTPHLIDSPASAENSNPLSSRRADSESKHEVVSSESTAQDASSNNENPRENSHDLPASHSSSHLPPDEWLQPKAPLEPVTLGQRGALRIMLQQARWTNEDIAAHLHTQFSCERIEELNGAQAAEWLLELQRAARLQAEQQRLSGSNHSRNGAKTGTSKNERT